MKIFVISDTHGRTEKVEEVWNRLTDVDLVLHLGDYEKDAQRLAQIFGVEVIGVKGNMDGSYSREDYRIVDTEYGKLLADPRTHGQVKISPLNCFTARRNSAAAPFYSDTPIFRFMRKKAGSILLIREVSPSPGTEVKALTRFYTPLKKNSIGAIVYYSSLHGGKKPPQTRRLRNMLNYSDRF